MPPLPSEAGARPPAVNGPGAPAPGALPEATASLQRAIDAVKQASRLPPGLGETLGRVQVRVADNPLSRWLMRHVFTRVAAFLIVTLRLFGVRKTPAGAPPSAIDIALNWQKVAAAFQVDTVVERAADDEVILVHPQCTMGYHSPDHRRLCDASMHMDDEIVRRLGGTLTILHRRLDGGEHCCRHRIRVQPTERSRDD